MNAQPTIVFQCAYGFVTDMGEALPIRDDRGALLSTLERYGVWKHTGHKFEVVLVTAHLDQAITLAGREPGYFNKGTSQ